MVITNFIVFSFPVVGTRLYEAYSLRCTVPIDAKNEGGCNRTRCRMCLGVSNLHRSRARSWVECQGWALPRGSYHFLWIGVRGFDYCAVSFYALEAGTVARD